ncbi:MAG: phosphohistidine phosphatase SixA [Chloroherpetonaceae bacterium]|nr:phosphohistidine phosphatase SixA [Chloroherpetonaceae bacterium]
MHLFLLRHGDAEERSHSGRDFDRCLTPEGVERLRAEALGMQRLALRIDRIYTSPLVRARQTAEIVAEILQLPTPAIDSRLASGRLDHDTLQSLLLELQADDRVLLVGHQPDMSEVIQQVTGGSVEMKRGALAAIELDCIAPPAGTLRFLLPPRCLIQIAH